jgi:hypothetical protein
VEAFSKTPPRFQNLSERRTRTMARKKEKKVEKKKERKEEERKMERKGR